uniref:Uncharacterized protein n=1 Tax=Cyclopterus lumpus TaxID=8103 RepID=A0A8C2ZYD0_CYCLU
MDATILKLLEVEHPAAKVLCELQDKEVGDGTTSVVSRVNGCCDSGKSVTSALYSHRRNELCLVNKVIGTDVSLL